MSTASDRLFDVRLKIERAEQHIRDTEGAIRAFLNLRPYEVGSDVDVQTQQWVYFMTRVDPVFPYISGLIGDVLNNLRSALDHLAFQLWLNGTGEGKERDVSYPVIDTDAPATYETRRAGKVKGMRQEAIDIIDATEPYKGGRGHQLWVLNQLNNIDKHRRLNLAALHFGGFWVHPDLLRHLKTVAKANPSIIGQPPPGYFFRPSVRVDALKCGDELYRCPPNDTSVEDQDSEFTFDVAIDEPPVSEGQPVVELLHELTHLVNGIVDRFIPLL